MKITKNTSVINFDIIIKTRRGKLYCVNIQRLSEYNAAAITNDAKEAVVNKTKAHRILGHSNEDAAASIAKVLGWKLTGPNERCESCQVAKAKQKAVPKLSNHVPLTVPGERLFLDLSIIKTPREIKHIGKKNWLMIVDETTHIKFSNFYKTKKRYNRTNMRTNQ